MSDTSSFPHDVIETSDLTANSAFHRLTTQSTWDEARALKRIVERAHAREMLVGMRSTPRSEPRMTFVVRAGTDAYIADAGNINVERQAREGEVREVLEEAESRGCAIVISSHLLPHTDGLRPREAAELLAKQDVVPVTDAARAMVALKRLLGR